MGGMAGRFLLDEYRRGACGTMPACEVTDVDVAIWERLEAGDLDGARRLHNRLLPLLNLEWLYGVSVYKEVLVRRGVIASATMRDPGAYPLDGSDLAELDAILADVGELFTLAPLREPAAQPRLMAHDWDAASYDQVANDLTRWGGNVVSWLRTARRRARARRGLRQRPGHGAVARAAAERLRGRTRRVGRRC